MATEQDWAAYADQAGYALSDTLLVRTAAGAGAEVRASDLLARRSSGGRFSGTGGLDLLTAAGANISFVPDASSGANGALIDVSFTAGGFGPLRFGTGGVERARIDNTGRLLVGTTSALGFNTLHEFKAAGAGEWPLLANCVDRGLLIRNSGNTTGFYAYFEYNGGTNNGSIAYSGTSTSFNTTSDYRLKTDLRPLTGCLDRVKALRVWDFEWVTTSTRAHGFMAHEYGEIVHNGATGAKDGTRVEEYEVEPERASGILGPDGQPVMIPAVMGTRTVPDYQGVDQSKVTPYLVGAVQELAALVEALQAEVAALRATA